MLAHELVREESGIERTHHCDKINWTFPIGIHRNNDLDEAGMQIVLNLPRAKVVVTTEPGCTQAKPNWLKFFVNHGIHETHGKSVRLTRKISYSVRLKLPCFGVFRGKIM